MRRTTTILAFLALAVAAEAPQKLTTEELLVLENLELRIQLLQAQRQQAVISICAKRGIALDVCQVNQQAGTVEAKEKK